MAHAFRHGNQEKTSRPAAGSRRYAGLIAAAASICAWEAAGRFLGIPADVLPTPSRIFMEISRKRALFWSNGCLTCLEATAGLLLAGATAVLACLAGILSSKVSRFAERTVRGLSLVPPAAAAPILLVWLGFGLRSRAAVAWFFSALFLAHRITAASGRLPVELTYWLRSTGAGPFLRIRKVYARGLLPRFLRDLRRALPLAVSGALTAEVIAADEGLGHLVVRGAASGDLPLLFAALFLSILFVGAAACALRLIERLSFDEHLTKASGGYPGTAW